MTDVSGQWGPAKAFGQMIDMQPDDAPAVSGLTWDERVCRWMFRLLLPVILALCGLLIFWMWFDDVYGPNAWSIAGGALMVVVAVPVALWTWHSWLPQNGELPPAADAAFG
jgi:hypothetical protein